MNTEPLHGDGAESKHQRLAVQCRYSSEAEARAKALKVKKAALEGVCRNTTNRRPRHPPSGGPRHCCPKIPERTLQGEISQRLPSTIEWETGTEDSVPVFTVDVQAEEHLVMQPVKRS